MEQRFSPDCVAAAAGRPGGPGGSPTSPPPDLAAAPPRSTQHVYHVSQYQVYHVSTASPEPGHTRGSDTCATQHPSTYVELELYFNAIYLTMFSSVYHVSPVCHVSSPPATWHSARATEKLRKCVCAGLENSDTVMLSRPNSRMAPAVKN